MKALASEKEDVVFHVMQMQGAARQARRAGAAGGRRAGSATDCHRLGRYRRRAGGGRRAAAAAEARATRAERGLSAPGATSARSRLHSHRVSCCGPWALCPWFYRGRTVAIIIRPYTVHLYLGVSGPSLRFCGFDASGVASHVLRLHV